MDRASDYGSEGSGFEFLQPHQIKPLFVASTLHSGAFLYSARCAVNCRRGLLPASNTFYILILLTTVLRTPWGLGFGFREFCWFLLPADHVCRLLEKGALFLSLIPGWGGVAGCFSLLVAINISPKDLLLGKIDPNNCCSQLFRSRIGMILQNVHLCER